MNHVYVAGSINMDVVATAARYPKMGETVPGREIFFFPGGKGSNQAGSIGAITILNLAPAIDFDRSLLHLVDILVLNETELGVLTRRSLHESDPESFFIEAARTLQIRDGQTVCVTLGRRGAVALNSDGVIAIPGRAVQPVDTTGAGDCFVGALAAQIAAGALIRAALEYANIAASLCVQRMGAGPSMPTAAEVAIARI